MGELPQFIDGLPNISGWDEARDEATHRGRDRSVFLHESGIDFGRARGACAVALHMHQPLIPAGGPGRGADPRREPLVGNLQFSRSSTPRSIWNTSRPTAGGRRIFPWSNPSGKNGSGNGSVPARGRRSWRPPIR